MTRHGAPQARPPSQSPTARRIADLSDEWITAIPERRREIDAEIQGIIDKRIVVLGTGD